MLKSIEGEEKKKRQLKIRLLPSKIEDLRKK